MKCEPICYEYVGNWQLTVGGKCPDFISRCGRKAIDVFGEYWHKVEEVPGRIAHFSEHGYKLLIVWGKELADSNALRTRLEVF